MSAHSSIINTLTNAYKYQLTSTNAIHLGGSQTPICGLVDIRLLSLFRRIPWNIEAN